MVRRVLVGTSGTAVATGVWCIAEIRVDLPGVIEASSAVVARPAPGSGESRSVSLGGGGVSRKLLAGVRLRRLKLPGDILRSLRYAGDGDRVGLGVK